MSSDRGATGRRSYETVGVALVAVAVVTVVSVGLAACGTTDEASRMTLPPLETTTTTTTTTTTIPQERFYTIQPGDSLSAIAASRRVQVVDILNANPSLENEDSIRAGDVIQIPSAGESAAVPGGTDASDSQLDDAPPESQP